MENRAHAIVAGLFVVLFGLALAAAILWFSGDAIEQDVYVLVSESSVSGLNPQAAVRYRGLQVGYVDKIRLDPKQPRVILIRILVDKETPVTHGTYAELAYQGLTGLAYIQLDDDGTAPKPLATSYSAPARIEMRASLLQEVGSSAPLLLARLSALTERLTGLLNEENLTHIKNTLANVEAVSARFIALQDKLAPTIDTLPSIAANTQNVLKHADELLVDLNKLTGQLERSLKTFDQVATSAGRVAASAEKIGKAGELVSGDLRSSALPKLERLLENISNTSHNLDKFLTNIERRPQSLIFGKPAAQPGPGEAGFAPPR